MAISSDAAALFKQHQATLELLSGIGVQNSELQNTVRAAVFADTASFAAITDADGVKAIADYVRLLMPRETLPALCDLYLASTEGAHFLGKRRVGDQIDSFPNASVERPRCEAAIAKNAGYKKAASQRDADKATAKAKAGKKKQGGGGGGEKKGNAAAAPASGGNVPENFAFALPDKTPIANDAPKDARMKKIFDALAHLKIEYETVEHPPVPTVDEMMEHLGAKPGGKCKNLFLKSSKPQFFTLVVALHDTTVDVKKLSKQLGSKKPMRFAVAEKTAELLGGNKGDLSPFALINDVEGRVSVCIDKQIMDQADGVWFHPLSNEASLRVSPKDLMRFIEATGHAVTQF